MSRSPFPALLLVLGAAACSPAVSSGKFSSQPFPPTSGEITLYSTKVPTCAYDEIGLVHVKRRHGFTDLQDLIDAMRERAREMGGNAIVGVGLAARVEGSSDSINLDRDVSGTVIRFQQPDCMR